MYMQVSKARGSHHMGGPRLPWTTRELPICQLITVSLMRSTIPSEKRKNCRDIGRHNYLGRGNNYIKELSTFTFGDLPYKWVLCYRYKSNKLNVICSIFPNKLIKAKEENVLQTLRELVEPQCGVWGEFWANLLLCSTLYIIIIDKN